MKIHISSTGDVEEDIRTTKWFNMSYVREEFKPGKSNHILSIGSKATGKTVLEITVAAGYSNSEQDRDAVYKFANSLPETADNPWIANRAKKLGYTVVSHNG